MKLGAGFLVVEHGLIVKMQYFFDLLVHTWAWIRQIKFIVKMTQEGSTIIVNFMTPGAGVVWPYRFS